jgi:hypothetical protein
VPGLIWCEDLVVADETGMLFLDYLQPLGILELVFGLTRGRALQGKVVEATGWFRRDPVPYVELHTLRGPDGETHTCYSLAARRLGAGLLVLLGGALAVWVLLR